MIVRTVLVIKINRVIGKLYPILGGGQFYDIQIAEKHILEAEYKFLVTE